MTEIETQSHAEAFAGMKGNIVLDVSHVASVPGSRGVVMHVQDFRTDETDRRPRTLMESDNGENMVQEVHFVFKHLPQTWREGVEADLGECDIHAWRTVKGWRVQTEDALGKQNIYDAPSFRRELNGQWQVLTADIGYAPKAQAVAPTHAERLSGERQWPPRVIGH